MNTASTGAQTVPKGNGRTLIGLLFLVLAMLVAPASASARHHRHMRPRLSWALPRTANEGQAISFSWAGAHLGRGHRLVVQKPEGTRQVWRTIIRLPSNTGSAELPGLALGKYRYRIADVAGRRVLAQKVAGVAVFGQVPFSTLFNAEEQVYATSTNTFRYVTTLSTGEGLPYFTIEHNHCRFVHMAFVGEAQRGFQGEGKYKSGIATLTVEQESRDPVSGSAEFDTVGSVDAEVVPGQSWGARVSEEGWYSFTAINGYAICDSTEAFFH